MANVKWSYQDHWSVLTPAGPMTPYSSRKYMDQLVKQIAAVGFLGYDSFLTRVPTLVRLFGSTRTFNAFLQDRGIEKVTLLFWSATSYIRETHDRLIRGFEQLLKAADGLGAEAMPVNPTGAYWQMAPVTDEKIKITADFWNRAGKLALEHGIKLGIHHEFWAGITTLEQIDKLYSWTDPKYVYFFCDSAQHTIAGVDPVALYLKYHDRCCGFHFKDTHTVDVNGDRFLPPGPETLAPSEPRWFWEPGTAGGKV